MPTRLKGKAFKISEDDARSYRYAKPMRSNPGVTHIAAINGRGSYSRKMTAREAMEGASPAQRAARARKALPNTRNGTMEYYGPNPSKRATPAQKAARARFAEMARSGALKRMRRNASTKGRRSKGQTVVISPMPIRSIGRATPRVSSVKSTARGGYSPLQAKRSTQRMAVAPPPARSSQLRKASQQTPRASRKATTVAQRPAAYQSAVQRAIGMIESGKKPFGRGLTAAVIAEAYRILGVTPPASSKRKSSKRKSKSKPAAAGGKKKSNMAKRKKSAKAAAPKGARKARKSSKKRSKKRVAKKGARKTKRSKASYKKAARKAARTRAAKKAKRSAAAKKGRRKARKSSKRTAKRAAKRSTRKTKRSKASYKKAARKAARTRKANKATGSRKPAKRRAKKGSRKPSTAAMHAALKKKYGWRGEATLAREGWKKSPKKRRKSRKSRKGVRQNSMRRNQMGSAIVSALKIGGTISAGFVAHKVASHLLNTIVFDRFLTPAVAEAAATEAAASSTAAAAPAEAVKAASGVGEIATVVRSTVGGGVAAVAGVMLANLLIKNQETKQLVAGGMVASFVHGVVVSALEALVPDAAPMLSGDGSAARLSAMMGIGASIDPRYAPISGYGEYLAEGTNGLGEYFDSGTSGLGNYGANPDIYEAAAGYGAIYEAAAGYGSNHISPSSNLEHELTMAEAAAGVGVSPYEAAAGYGEYFDGPVSGFGSVAALPGVDTAIPGGQLWAGTRSIDSEQNDTAMVPAGILETPGGAGILG